MLFDKEQDVFTATSSYPLVLIPKWSGAHRKRGVANLRASSKQPVADVKHPSAHAVLLRSGGTSADGPVAPSAASKRSGTDRDSSE
mmetsp:Transcript_50232/g.83243  ORF Transcript_50232/g.83243 Transcript_50232/m.83243 type:complete len:86 (+) Transcript_50232:32-289(+)